jgi:hypothetical protein
MGSLIAQGIVGVLLPAVLALILNGLVLRISGLGEVRKWAVIGLIIVCCFIFSFCVVFGGVVFPPREATHWLPFIAIGALVFGLLLSVSAGVAKILLRLIPVCATAWVLLQSQVLGDWPFLLSVGALVAVAGLLFLTSELIERWEKSRHMPVEALLGMALSAGFGGVALFFGGSAVLGTIGGAFGLVLAGLAVATFLSPPPQLGPVIPLIFTLVFGGLLLNGSLFSDLPWVTTALFWVAPLIVFVGPSAPPKQGKTIRPLMLRGIAVLAVIALAFFALFLITPVGAE